MKNVIRIFCLVVTLLLTSCAFKTPDDVFIVNEVEVTDKYKKYRIRIRPLNEERPNMWKALNEPFYVYTNTAYIPGDTIMFNLK